MWLALLIAPLALAEPEPETAVPEPEPTTALPAPEPEEALPESSVPDAPALEATAPIEPSGEIVPDDEPDSVAPEPVEAAGPLPVLEMLDEPTPEEAAAQAPPVDGLYPMPAEEPAIHAAPVDGIYPPPSVYMRPVDGLYPMPVEEAPIEAPPVAVVEPIPEEELLATSAEVFEAPPPPPEEPDDTAVRPFVGAFGALGTAGAGLGFASGGWAEAGLRLPWVRGRFAPFLRVGIAGSRAPGTVEEPIEVDYTVHYLAIPVVPGLSVRVLPASDVVSPELAVGPQIVAQRTVVAADDDEGVPLSEWSARVGVAAGAGLSARAGRGNVVVLAHFDWVPLGSSLSGDVAVPIFGVAAGYRFLPTARPQAPGGAL